MRPVQKVNKIDVLQFRINSEPLSHRNELLKLIGIVEQLPASDYIKVFEDLIEQAIEDHKNQKLGASPNALLEETIELLKTQITAIVDKKHLDNMRETKVTKRYLEGKL